MRTVHYFLINAYLKRRWCPFSSNFYIPGFRQLASLRSGRIEVRNKYLPDTNTCFKKWVSSQNNFFGNSNVYLVVNFHRLQILPFFYCLCQIDHTKRYLKVPQKPLIRMSKIFTSFKNWLKFWFSCINPWSMRTMIRLNSMWSSISGFTIEIMAEIGVLSIHFVNFWKFFDISVLSFALRRCFKTINMIFK